MTPNEWKRGDKLKCVEPDASGRLSSGVVYTFHCIASDGTVYIDEISGVSFFTWRFEHVSPAEKQFILTKELAAKINRLVSIVERETNSQSVLDEARSVLEELNKDDKS